MERELPVIDPHHHLWDVPGNRYLLDDLLNDVHTGHHVEATVFVECGARYRTSGPAELRPVGEVEFAAATAVEGFGREPDGTRICEGIVSRADLMLGSHVAAVIEQEMSAAGGRLRGVRHSVAWDAAELLRNPSNPTFPGMLLDRRFQEGVAVLGEHGLSFDAWLLHPQLDELANLAARCPSATIVLDHLGGPVTAGPYAARSGEVFPAWSAAIRRIAAFGNVRIKIGGLGMRFLGSGLSGRPVPASSAELAGLWRPWIETAIEAFGPARCMFESNFPVDKASYGYVTGWNAFKIVSRQYGPADRQALLSGTARATYRLG